MKNFTGEFDTEFPMMNPAYNLSYCKFRRDFESKDLQFDDECKKICQEKKTRLIDFRPYMIENPFTVCTTDTLPKIVDIFRNQHLRHLPVVHPGTGALKGIITRKDLFNFMDL